MLNESKVMWTALPQGMEVKDGKQYVIISAFVSIRLRTDQGEELGIFPEFLEWPKRLRGMEFSVDFGGQHQAKAEPRDPKLVPTLWGELFKKTTYLKSFEFDDFSKNKIISFPVKPVSAFIKNHYQGLASVSPTDLPEVSTILGPSALGRLKMTQEDELEVRQQLNASYGRRRALGVQDIGEMAKGGSMEKLAMVLIKLFHEAKTPSPVPLPKYPMDAKKFEEMVDFHQMLASLANFPEVMKRLGLLLEFRVPANEVPLSKLPNPLAIQLLSPSFGPSDYRPKTAYSYDEHHFLPCPRPGGQPDYQGGMLPFHLANQYETVQFDVDGAAIKLMNLVHDLDRAEKHKSQDTPKEQGAPVLRAAGLSVARVDRGVKLNSAFVLASGHEKDLNNHAPTLLYAEDVSRGFRVDVWDSVTKKWHSLNCREGAYIYRDDQNLEHLIKDKLVDEGWVQAGVTKSPDPNVPDHDKALFAHESLFNWKGWSLSVTRPGLSIDTDDEVRAVEPILATQLKVKATFKPVKGSLPRLRFGRVYRFRARMVDLGGHSVTVKEADDSQATLEVPYLRFEPVTPPVLLLREELDPDVRSGESLERLVIRSFNEKPAQDQEQTKERSERHVAPPKISQMDAELHGMFDEPGKGEMKLDGLTYSMISAKDKGRFQSVKAGDPIEPSDKLELPYMPDPLAIGATMVRLPGASTGQGGSMQHGYYQPGIYIAQEPVLQQDFGKLERWPEMRPFRIQLAEGDAEPQWDEGARLLTVCLPKAGAAKFKLSSYLPEDKLGLMGIWHWVEEAHEKGKINATDYAHLRKLAIQGRHWMITPFRWIYMVHAVQQPLGVPEFQGLMPNKQLGKTYAHLSGMVGLDGKSAIKMDLLARWEERRDDPSDAKNDPVKDRIKGAAHVFDMHILPHDEVANFFGESQRRHDFGDTRYRHVLYQAVTTTRFKEYLPKSIREDPQAKITRESQEVEIDILNSARPALPRLEYVIPIFGWLPSIPMTMSAKSVRRGNALRVYMNRPWFSSGDGEKLGVVLWPGKLPTDEDELDQLKPCVTMFGMDPIWRSKPTAPNLKMEDFKRRLPSSRSGLTLNERPGQAFDVAAHEVSYDPERQLWYADIVFDAGEAYTPFVRLALTRYQPDSVDHAHLSPVVLADFSQLNPDRTLSIIHSPGMVKVTVSGISYTARAGESGQVVGGSSEIEVSVQRYEPKIGTDLGWVSEPEAKATKDHVSAPSTLYSGTVILPPPPKDPKVRPPKYRLVVKEFEAFDADRAVPLLTALNTPSMNYELGKRLVYLDYIEL